MTEDRDLNANHRVDLTGLARGKAEVNVRIELNAAGAEMPAWCCCGALRSSPVGRGGW